MEQDGSPVHSEANRSGRPKVPLQAVTRLPPQTLVVRPTAAILAPR